MQIDLNCDIGEGFGTYQMGADEELMPLISSANIACGFHGGDPQTLDRTIVLASKNGVSVGAHPGHFDLRGFGRRPIQASPKEVEADVLYQVGAVAGFARSHGVGLVHVKPHGALYNQAVNDGELSRAIARGVARFSRELILVGLATSKAMRDAAEAEGLRYAGEAFADRVYNPDGTLQSRRIEGSVITDSAKAAVQALSIARDRKVTSHDGGEVALEAETLCLHGDNPSAIQNAQAIRQVLADAGVGVRSLSSR